MIRSACSTRIHAPDIQRKAVTKRHMNYSTWIGAAEKEFEAMSVSFEPDDKPWHSSQESPCLADLLSSLTADGIDAFDQPGIVGGTPGDTLTYQAEPAFRRRASAPESTTMT
jgi:hypothetical protein